MAQPKMSQWKLRVGQGIDVHQLVKDRPFILGGVSIPYHLGLDGHSDADALTHSVIDALLGAAGEGDIGTFFPPTDPKWKDANSLELLRQIWDKLRAEGWAIENIDCTVLAEAPKILPHVPAMKRSFAEVLGLEVNAIGIKATTTEKMGFVGRGEGVLTQAVALLSRQS